MRTTALLAVILLLAACGPSDQRPGLWLPGEEQATLPEDWSFTDVHPEIYLEVTSPYLLPHSVTIWCAQVDGTLYVAARAPETKRWPGWVEDDPDVRIQIDDTVYPVHLELLTDPVEIARVSQAYGSKYDLAGGFAGDDPSVGQRYWRVTPPT